MYKISKYQFYNTSEYTLNELVNDSEHIAANFKSYINGFSSNIIDIIRSLDFDKQIDKMDKNNRLLSVVKAFSELDLNPKTIDNVKMGYIFEDLIRKFSENAEAGDHYTGRDIIKCMVNILLAEGCDDIFDDGNVITILDQACGTGGMLSTGYNFIKRYNPTADVRLFGQEVNPESYACALRKCLSRDRMQIMFAYRTQCKRIVLQTRLCVLLLKILLSELRGVEKTLLRVTKKPYLTNIRRALTDVGAQGFPDPEICSCCLYSRQ